MRSTAWRPAVTSRSSYPEVTISNGLAWNPEGTTAYYVDTATHRIDAFDWCSTRGLHQRRTLVRIPKDRGVPGGLTVDAEGHVWVALWGNAAVHRYTPAGQLDDIRALPVTPVTACTFGGRDLRELFSTASRDGIVPDHQPAACGVSRRRRHSRTADPSVRRLTGTMRELEPKRVRDIVTLDQSTPTPRERAHMGRTVPAVMRALDILELFLDGQSHSTPEITQQLELPRTSVHELITTLVHRRYLVPQPDQPGHYRIGVSLFQLGSVFAEQLDLAREGRLVSENVAANCDETVHVAVLDDTDVVYIAKVDSPHPVRLVSAPGRRLPAHCTAIGKAMLASMPATTFDADYPRGSALAGMTPNSITAPSRLRQHLAEVRDRGVAFEYCESNEAAACVAAPVRDSSSEVIAAMSISVPTLRWSDQVANHLAQQISDGAVELSRRLGYRI